MANVLAKLRQQVINGRREGTRCPCCTQYAREYDRTITSSMVWVLSLIHKWFKQNDPNYDQKWLHVENHLREVPNTPASLRGDFPKLKHWGLIEQRPGTRPDGSNRAGYWRITKKGIDFLNSNIQVEKYATIFDGNLIRMSNDKIWVVDCLNVKFDYSKLMSTK